MSGSHLSKDFFDLVKAIGESKSKQEEDRIIMNEVSVLKRKMPEATVGRNKMKEFLVRMIYVEMLGHDASFGYIKAVELTASQNLAQKRSGYLTAAVTLSPDHEFRFMLVNQMQRDLSSSNMLEAAAALTALCKLATVDMIPAIMTEVVRLLKHDRELVRKKAVMVLHRLHQLDPESVSHMGDHLRRMLCDKDPSVMGAALCLLHDLVKDDTASFKDLVPSFVSILKQITEHRLPRDFDYHRMPAPWIQMRLLRILALLGRADRATSEGMYEVLMDVMRRADTGINVGYAVVYECVRTVTTIYPNGPLLDSAAASISRFISAENHNLKYVGVTGLASIVRDHPKYAQEHQMAVIDCLEDPDETLKRKTLDLLYTMTNPVNVEFIAEKLLSFLEQGTDSFWRQDLVKRITQCAERFAPSNSWYVGVITRVFRLAGDMVKSEVAHNLMQLIAEGSGEDEEADEQLRREAVDNYLEILDTPAVPDQLMQVMAWVLGEYGSLVSSSGGVRLVSSRLCAVASELSFRDPRTCGFVVTALMKLSAQSGEVSPPVAHLLTLYSQSKQSDLQQRCLEFLQLAREGPAAMAAVLPVDASCEDVEVDENLSHLDGIVSAALAAGAVGYSPPAVADDDSEDDGSVLGRRPGSSFNLTPYARPNQPATGTTLSTAPQAPLPPPMSSQSSSSGAGAPISTADLFASGPRLRPVSKVWGRPKPGEQHQKPMTVGAGSSAVAPTTAPTSATSVPSGVSSTGVSSKGTAGNSGRGAAPQAEEDPLVAAQRAERERMAAMLFGGTGARPTPTAASSPASVPGTGGLRPKITSSGFRSSAAASAAPTTSPAPAARTTQPSAGSPPPVDLLDFSTFEGPAGEDDGATTRVDGGGSSSPVDLLGVGGGRMENSGSPSPSSPGGVSINATNGSASAGASPQLGAVVVDDLLGGGYSASNGSGGNMRRVSNGGSITNHGTRAGSLGAGSPPSGPSTTILAGASVPGLDLSGLFHGGSPAGGRDFSFGGGVVKPLSIATQEFGKSWMACSGERRAGKLPLGSGLRSLNAAVEKLVSHLGLHKVEIISQTAEGICAGQLEGGGSSGSVCLVHCKVWPTRGTVDITVRADDAKLAEAVLSFAKSVLSQ